MKARECLNRHPKLERLVERVVREAKFKMLSDVQAVSLLVQRLKRMEPRLGQLPAKRLKEIAVELLIA